MATKKTKQKEPAPEVLELSYQLAELPSSQHRAGLAGLVLMVDWLKRQPSKKGMCEFTHLDAYSATLRLDQQGLKELFNEIYAASMEEKAESKLRKKGKTDVVLQPLREEIKVEIDAKGKKKESPRYIYEVPIPQGAFLLAFDPSANGKDGPWVKLWREMMWSILRGVPASRNPFVERAEGKQPNDSIKTWEDLCKPGHYTVKLPSTYFIGAQENNAEDVQFKDRAKFQFLLHFWSYAAQIYVPTVINKEGKGELSRSFALAIPDVANLELFCEELPPLLRGRGKEMSGYRPRDCVVDLAIESALDIFRRLSERLQLQAGSPRINDLMLGVDVVHVEKQGNNIRLLGSTRIDPEDGMIDEYARFHNSLWNPIFRRQRLLNLVNRREWHIGFDSLMAKLPFKQTIGDGYFQRDARESFKNEVKTMNDPNDDSANVAENNDPNLPDSINDEGLIYRVVSNYLRFKLKSKHQLEWKKEWKGLRDNKPAELKKYEEMKTKLAREAFLAIRSRTDQDFVAYFASTLCSVSQSMSEERFVLLTQALVKDTDKIRTLTMLALAAQTPNPPTSSAQSTSGA